MKESVNSQTSKQTPKTKPDNSQENAAVGKASTKLGPRFADEDQDDDDDEYDDEDDYSIDEDDYGEESDGHVTGNCLHCHLPPPPADKAISSTSSQTALGIQVSCDECHSFICSTCHWCHEFQANHEIRVCDRCDAFYCKACDEMDQCEDCGEVVCSGCTSLCSCKFCGCGLCEECATACGRCGIVLCSRDAKFAVECDTCKLPYCLVCLASGTKDPCVRCGCRTSKRVEQLVHLRLKSIYKAFKQSGAALGVKAAMSEGHVGKSGKEGHIEEGGSNDTSQSSKKHSRGTTVSIPLPASIAKFAKTHSKEVDLKQCTISEKCTRKDDLGTVLHAAAVTAASVVQGRSSGPNDFFGESMGDLFFNAALRPNESSEISRHRIRPVPKQAQSPPAQSNSSRNKSKDDDAFENKIPRTLADADAAAAALLAELDEEKMLNEASNQAKKDKKKKKKEKLLAAKEKEKTQEQDQDEMVADLSTTEIPTQAEPSLLTVRPLIDNTSIAPNELLSPNKAAEDGHASRSNNAFNSSFYNHSSLLSPETLETPIDELEKKLLETVEKNDVNGIESILFQLKGVPGRALLRKNAKKALKRIIENSVSLNEGAGSKVLSAEKTSHNSSPSSPHAVKPVETPKPSQNLTNESALYKAPEPLLKVISQPTRSSSSSLPNTSNHRTDCVLHLHPSIVGWVIGKGGQKIRDLMEESGAKLWIDQESMGPKDMRIVYASGSRKSVDTAVRLVKDLVSKAPIYTPSNHTPDLLADDDEKNSTITSRSKWIGSIEAGINESSATESTKVTAALDADVGQTPHMLQMEEEILSHTESSPNRDTFPPLAGSQSLEGQRLLSQALTCDARFVPLLIGRRGWTIKHIQDTSGAKIDIDQTVSPRKIIISGEKSQVEQGIQLVRDVLSYPHAQLQASQDNIISMGYAPTDDIQNVGSPSQRESYDSLNQIKPGIINDHIHLASRDKTYHSRSLDIEKTFTSNSHCLNAPQGLVSTQLNFAFNDVPGHDHRKNLANPPPGIFQNESVIPVHQLDPVYPSQVYADSLRTGYPMTAQSRDLYSYEPVINTHGSKFHVNQNIGLQEPSRVESSYSLDQAPFLSTNFPPGVNMNTASNTSMPMTGHLFVSQLGGNPFSTPGAHRDSNSAQTTYSLTNAPNDRDIDGMFGPSTFVLSNMDSTQGHVTPLVTEFASAMKFDASSSDSTPNETCFWDNLTHTSTGTIPTLFPSKSKRSSNNHSIGLGGVKLDS